jgi:transcriptional regulator with XRE-family HTH domain
MLEKKVRPGELARQLGVSAGQVSRWRKGEMPGGLRFREIAAALTVSVDWLKTGAVGLEPEDKPIVPTVERKAVRDLREAEAAIQAQLKRDYTDQGKSPPAYLIVGWLKTPGALPRPTSLRRLLGPQEGGARLQLARHFLRGRRLCRRERLVVQGAHDVRGHQRGQVADDLQAVQVNRIARPKAGEQRVVCGADQLDERHQGAVSTTTQE